VFVVGIREVDIIYIGFEEEIFVKLGVLLTQLLIQIVTIVAQVPK
jgi:hypothetical protein